jgi:uncharacterized membrane protein
MSRRVLLVVLLLLAAAALAQALYWAPQLPERVASHFDASDRADGWMGRSSFLVLLAVLHAVMLAVFIGLPLLLDRLPDALINLPDKSYWLAPERRAISMRHVGDSMLAIGCATLLLLLVIFQAVYALNADLARGLSGGSGVPELVLPLPFVAVMGLYVAVVAAVLARMLLRFRPPR